MTSRSNPRPRGRKLEKQLDKLAKVAEIRRDAAKAAVETMEAAVDREHDAGVVRTEAWKATFDRSSFRGIAQNECYYETLIAAAEKWGYERGLRAEMTRGFCDILAGVPTRHLSRSELAARIIDAAESQMERVRALLGINMQSMRDRVCELIKERDANRLKIKELESKLLANEHRWAKAKKASRK